MVYYLNISKLWYEPMSLIRELKTCSLPLWKTSAAYLGKKHSDSETVVYKGEKMWKASRKNLASICLSNIYAFSKKGLQ